MQVKSLNVIKKLKCKMFKTNDILNYKKDNYQIIFTNNFNKIDILLLVYIVS